MVLENPYELSSFYRSSEGSYMGPGYPMYPGSGYYGSSGSAPAGADRYPIASYYRQRDGWYGYGYAPFWTGGYGAYDSAVRRTAHAAAVDIAVAAGSVSATAARSARTATCSCSRPRSWPRSDR